MATSSASRSTFKSTVQLVSGIGNLLTVIQIIKTVGDWFPMAGIPMTFLDFLTSPLPLLILLLIGFTLLWVFAGKISNWRRVLSPDISIRQAAEYVLTETPDGRGKAREYVLNRIQEKAGDDDLRVWGGMDEKVVAPIKFKSERHAFVFSGVGDWFCLIGGPTLDSYITYESGKAVTLKAESWISPKLCRWQLESVFPRFSLFSRARFALLKKLHNILNTP